MFSTFPVDLKKHKESEFEHMVTLQQVLSVNSCFQGRSRFCLVKFLCTSPWKRAWCSVSSVRAVTVCGLVVWRECINSHASIKVNGKNVEQKCNVTIPWFRLQHLHTELQILLVMIQCWSIMTDAKSNSYHFIYETISALYFSIAV